MLSARIRVSAAAASSNAQLTDEVSLRSTSGSAKALPSAVDSLPIPSVPIYDTAVHRPEKEKREVQIEPRRPVGRHIPSTTNLSFQKERIDLFTMPI